MSYKISVAGKFEREIKRLIKKFPSLKTEFADLLKLLKSDPFIGSPMGSDCYKIRISIASKGKGKSGGARVITHVYVAQTTVYLLSIYDKSEQADITDKELQQILAGIGK